MNYENYERQIVECLGVELIGWPLHGSVQQPGKLSYEDAVILRNALVQKDCKWVKLTCEQVLSRKDNNLEREANGEAIYGPSRKRRARNNIPADREEGNNGDIGQVDVEMPDA
jgi:hypothetical protein